MSFMLAVTTLNMVSVVATQRENGMLAAADRALREGRFADAARVYEAWLQERSASAPVLLALGICYLQTGRNDEAIAVLRRHLALAPRSASGRAALGLALLNGARPMEARAELERAVRLDPRQSDAVEALARLDLTQGRAAHAVALLAPLAQQPGARESLRALLGEALVRAGRPAAALAVAEQILSAQSPENVYALAAEAARRAGKFERAAEICEQGMKLYPDSEIETVYLRLPSATLAARIVARLARVRAAPELSEMIALGRVLLGVDPARKTRANEIARQILAAAVELAPDDASARYNYGRALSTTDLNGALVEWERALALARRDELRLRILLQIARAKNDLGESRGAERAYRAAIEINRQLPQRRPEATLEYARFLQLQGRQTEAEALVRETLVWNPLAPEAHLEWAKLLAARREWERVVEEATFVLQTADGDDELERAAHALLARAFYHLKQPERAQWHRGARLIAEDFLPSGKSSQPRGSLTGER